jgi:hypothetical protein
MSDQTGGKLLAQGVDGCVFIPKLKCKGNSTDFLKASRLMVDKIVRENEAQHEYTISQKIVKIPLASNYFVFPEMICTPESADKQTEPELRLCEIKTPFKDTKILRMPYGGTSLPNYNFALKKLSSIQFAQHLLEAGALLALNGIVHNDIHMGNILVDANQIPRIIDFSRSLFVYENIQEKDLLVESAIKSPHLCPDFSILNDSILGYTQDYIIKNYIKYEQAFIDNLIGMLGINPSNVQNSFEEFTLLSSSYKKLDLVEWFTHHWRTIDSWAIGMGLLTTFSALVYFKEFASTWDQEGKILIPVIRRLLEVNPFRRIDCVQALDMLNNLIGDDDNLITQKIGASWLDKVGRVRL